MNKKTDEKLVSEFYHSIEENEGSAVPSHELDSLIIKAAVDGSKSSSKKNKYFLPLSAVASVLVIVSVALTMSVVNDSDTLEYQKNNIIKKPMYMMQRSKPATAIEMVDHVNALLDKGELEHARILFKKIKVRYPNHSIEMELAERLK